jgi:hypothetical protein
MTRIKKIYNYIMDRMLAISPDERDEAEIKVIKEAKLEELNNIIDVMNEIILEDLEAKLDEEMEIRDVPSIVIGMGNKTMGTRIKTALRYCQREEFVYLKDLRKLRYKRMLYYRNMGPTSANILKDFCISQNLWEDRDHE